MTQTETSSLVPGLLVSLKTSIKGNVRYAKRTIQPDTEAEDGSRSASWETDRFIADAKEHKLSAETRAKARNVVANVCIQTAFGLLCPEAKAVKLEEALDEADKLVRAFNRAAKLSRIEFNVARGRIEPNDERAIRGINSEVRDLLDMMQDAIGKLDAKAVRAAANRARLVGQMLSPQAYAKVSTAIDAARAKAREIVKAGELAAKEVNTENLRAIAVARTAFLDMDTAGELAAPTEHGRAVEFEAETEAREPGSYQTETRQIEV